MKGASLSSVRVCAENLPGAHAFLCSIHIDGRKDVQIGEQDAAELRQIGLFAPTDAMPQAVAYQFPLRDPACSGTLLSRSSMSGTGNRNAQLSALRLPADWWSRRFALNRSTMAAHGHRSAWLTVRDPVNITETNDTNPGSRRRLWMQRRPMRNSIAKALPSSKTCFLPNR